MAGRVDRLVDVSRRTAMGVLVLFIAAVATALGVTISSVAASVQILAAIVVTPVIVLALLFLYFEERRRPWSFAGAAALGISGVTLRLVVNAHPQLEVGGGLPFWVTATYVGFGILVIVTSLWALVALRRADRQHQWNPSSSEVPPPPA